MTKMITLANNIEIEYEERGQGAPLLLLHGSGSSWRLFDPQIPTFAKNYRMIMPNLRGHGNSSPLLDGTNYHEVMADDVKLFLDAIGIDQPIPVYGESMGAVVALHLASKYPEVVEKLIPVCGYSEMPGTGGALALWLSNAIFAMMSMKTITKLMFAAAYPEKQPGSALTRKTIENSLAVDKATFTKLKTSGFVPVTAKLPRIKAPTLVMGGNRMKMEENGSRLIASKIPGAQLAIFAGGGDPLSTYPQQIHDEMVLDFLAGRPLKQYTGVTYA